jgi:hypothetical protein
MLIKLFKSVVNSGKEFDDKAKAISVQAVEAYRVEMSRIPHCIDNRLTDGGKVVGPTHRQHFISQQHSFSASGTHFCYRLSEPQSQVRPEGLGKFKISFSSSGLEPAIFRLVAVPQSLR